MFLKILAYLTIGAVIGWITNLVAGERGVKLVPSILFGMSGAIITTIIAYLFELAGAGYYAALGAFLMLFTVNVFRKKKEPVFEEDRI